MDEENPVRMREFGEPDAWMKDLTDDELIARIMEPYRITEPDGLQRYAADVHELVRRYRVAKWCRLAESKFRDQHETLRSAAIAAGFTPPKEEVTP
jgi:hypothetical protein